MSILGLPGRERLAASLEDWRRARVTRFGLQVSTPDQLTLLQGMTLQGLEALIAPAGLLQERSESLHAFDPAVTIWAEVTRWSPELETLPARVAGFVLKGHECSGAVSEQTTFILLQEFRRHTTRQLIARGGITTLTAAAAAVAGASGVMLDDQIMLLPEAGLQDQRVRQRIEAMSGNETVQVEGPRPGSYIRGFALNNRSVEQALAIRMAADGPAVEAEAAQLSWREGDLKPGGQGLVLASGVLRRHRTLGRFIGALRRAWMELPDQAARRGVLGEGGALAKTDGIRFPIFQGPMTRVSDVSEFFAKVSEGGALPFAALALLSGERTQALLSSTVEKMNGRPWGVGLLGFMGPKVLKPQFEAIAKHPPQFAIVAGARIDQLQTLEGMGIRSFAHVSSASMLTHYLDEGITRFIIEGRECGGHIGPLSSFVLWSALIEALENHPAFQKSAASIQLVFAGGIHDDVSAAMVSTLAETVAARGVQIGVLMGTAYLFTREIVETGAILPDYQDVALACGETQSLWVGPGYASRCAVTPIAEEFRHRRAELQARNASVTEIKDALEHYSLGRLRMATKGVVRSGADGSLSKVDEAQRRREGMYMIGQVAAMHDGLQSIAQLHDTVSNGSVRFLEAFSGAGQAPAVQSKKPRPADIAIVGMATLLPGSETLESYWRRILSGESAIREIPSDRWSLTGYFSKDPAERDKIYSMRGGFLPDIVFNPLDHGIPPSSIPSIDPMQLLALEVVSDAMKDASLGGEFAIDRERTSVVLGFSGGLGELGAQYATRSELKRLMGRVPEEMLARLPDWTEDSFAGLLPNVAAGRVANRLDLGGFNQTVDAACASSLAALYLAVQELETGRSDAVIAGGVDTLQSPFGYLCFAKTKALSPRGVCNTFDVAADGIVISEGLAAVVLKRLSDAERDGDRIYAVIKGVGASSDGRGKGLTAPLPKGQKRALRRAYEQAGFAPSDVQLLEAHGTGTVAGDKAELETIIGLLDGTDVARKSIAIGSVKTLIGHTKATAGIAGLIKVAKGLHHRVLPPHALVKSPNPAFRAEETPLFLSQLPRPWIVPDGQPRRAGVSAFGFGGTNFHVALEEYADPAQALPPGDAGEELVPFAFAAESRNGLAEAVKRLAGLLERMPGAPLADLALATLGGSGPHRLAWVARSHAELAALAGSALAFLTGSAGSVPAGMFHSDAPALLSGGKLAFLFSGQGAQYPDMHRQTALLAPSLLAMLCRAETLLARTPSFRRAGRPLARLIYPGDAFSPEEGKAQMAALTATEIAQPALGAIEAGLAATLEELGVRPDMAAGHSYGEFAALWSAGVLSFDDLITLSEARGRAMVENADPAQPGAMLAVKADANATRATLAGLEGVTIANLNSPLQTVIAGNAAAMERAGEALKAAGLNVARVPVSQAFHSPLMAPARQQFETALADARWGTPSFPVYSNRTAEPHDPAAIREAMAQHLVSSVDFVSEVRNMVRDGARVFLEIGPKSILADRGKEIVTEPGIVPIALDQGKVDAFAFIAGLARLFVEGAAVDINRLLHAMARPGRRSAEAGPNSWLLNGAYARRADAPRRDVEPPARDIIVPSENKPEDEELEFMEIKPEPAFQPGGPPGHGPDEMMASYHRLMTEFLRVQESVMRAYLQGGAAGLPALQAPAAPAPAFTPRAALASPQPVAVTPRVAPEPVRAPEQPAPVHAAAAPAAVAPAAAVAVAPAAPVQAGTALSPEETLAAFIRIVADKTGYPADTLDPDQALEADLGVDSIKRMEILSTMQKLLPEHQAHVMRGHMDAVSQLATMRQIVNFVFEKAASAGSAPQAAAPVAASPFDHAGEASRAAKAVLPRYVQVPFGEDAAHVPWDLPQNALVVVTESGDGFHHAVLAALAAKGIEGRSVRADDAGTEWFAALDLGERPLAIVHCASRANADPAVIADAAHWQALQEQGTKAVFRLLQSAQGRLKAGGRFLAVMETGGLFGRDMTVAAAMPAEAGVVGLVKSLSLEWPGCSLKVVDLDPAEDHARQAEHVLRELSMLPGRREAGYPAGRRTIFRTEAAATEPPQEPGIRIGPDWVVVASGGARGITAECLRTLAPSGCTMVLLGRSQPADPEPDALRGLDVAGLRAHFLAEARAAGGKPRPAEIEKSVQAHLARRDMEQNLRDLAALGARIDYRAIDVCDGKAVQELFAGLLRQYHRIDMVVHGAGLIEDTSFEKKTAASFDRVFDTKVASAASIVQAARNPALKSVCFFTSVAGRYGNPGQADYAAANETLNFLARALKRGAFRDCRIKAINWGPWDATTTGAGMVTESTRAQFLARGIGMVEPAPGRAFFWREMFWSDPEQVECVGWVADGETMEAEVCDLPADAGAVAKDLLLLDGARLAGDDALAWRFDMVSAPYADDHRFDRHAVMPMAGMMQILSEVPAAFGIAGQVIELRSLRMFQGLTLKDGPLPVRIELAAADGSGVRPVRVLSEGKKPRILYQAGLVMADGLPRSARKPSGSSGIAPWSGPSVDTVYRQWLSHGPRFQTIAEITALDAGGIRTRVSGTDPADFVAAGKGRRWNFDPGLIDGMLQALWVWTRSLHDLSGLPLGADSVRRFAGDPRKGPVLVEIGNIHLSDGNELTADVFAFDAAGELCYQVDGFKVQCARSLNRLGGGWAGGERTSNDAARKAAE